VKWISLVITAVAFIITGCAATWSIQGHAPTQDNIGTCAAPILVPTSEPWFWIKYVRNGPSSGRDSVKALPGGLFVFPLSTPSGFYTLRAFATDSAGNTTCDTTISVAVKGKAANISDLQAR